jgi:hypothetical protein
VTVIVRETRHRRCFVPAHRLVLENDVEGVDNTRNVTEDGQQNVDEEVGAAATLEEDT